MAATSSTVPRRIASAIMPPRPNGISDGIVNHEHGSHGGIAFERYGLAEWANPANWSILEVDHAIPAARLLQSTASCSPPRSGTHPTARWRRSRGAIRHAGGMHSRILRQTGRVASFAPRICSLRNAVVVRCMDAPSPSLLLALINSSGVTSCGGPKRTATPDF